MFNIQIIKDNNMISAVVDKFLHRKSKILHQNLVRPNQQDQLSFGI